jgi:biotin synthase-related radical SAM superfamily protein
MPHLREVGQAVLDIVLEVFSLQIIRKVALNSDSRMIKKLTKVSTAISGDIGTDLSLNS